jgi:formylglycine-generating enzyme required for sulfatase activity
VNRIIRFNTQKKKTGETLITCRINNEKPISIHFDPGKEEHAGKLAEIFELQLRDRQVDEPLRLLVEETDILVEDPFSWEKLHSSDGRPFSCRQDVTLVHPVKPVQPVDFTSGPILTGVPKILVAACSPQSLETLDCDAELNRVRAALLEGDSEGSIAAFYREIRTKVDLMNVLNEIKPDIFHFIGHAVDVKGVRQLALEKGISGLHTGLDLEEMKLLLANAGTRMVVLNACRTQVIARFLALKGFVAVGMREPILDSYARIFAEGFYRSLARGSTIDQSIGEGRLRLYIEDKEEETWSYPVLYVPGDEVVGFRIEKDFVPMAEVLIDCGHPGHAVVFVNEEKRGLTPMKLQLRPGYPHMVRLEREGYKTIEKTIIPKDRKERINIDLEPRLSNLSVQVNPGVKGVIVRCRRIDNREEVYETVTDVTGKANFQGIRVGKYQIDASLELGKNYEEMVDEDTAGKKPLILNFSHEIYFSDVLTTLGYKLLRFLRQPMTIGAIVLFLIAFFITIYSIGLSTGFQDVPQGMIRIEGAKDYQVLGMDLDEKNTSLLEGESEEERKLRISWGNKLIRLLRRIIHLRQMYRARGDMPDVYNLEDTFYIDKTEVTVSAYSEFLKAIKRNPGRLKKHPMDTVNKKIPGDLEPEEWQDQQDCPTCPVVGVDFFDTWSFAAFLGKRLPTNKEWEMAARGKEGRMFPWGNDYEQWRFNGYTSYKTEVVPAASPEFTSGKTPGGIYDMAGNADEWVILQDIDGKLKTGILGGSFVGRNQIDILPYGYFEKDPGDRDNTIGFRCAADKPIDTENMVPVPPGQYKIGGLRNFYFDMIRDLKDVTTGDQKQDLLGETPKRIDIKPFYIDEHEVTVGQYAEFIDAIRLDSKLHSRLWPDQGPGFGMEYMPNEWEKQIRDNRDFPVTGVSWYMATAFARWKGKRLPTIFEFEYLIGGPNCNLFPTGDKWEQEILIKSLKNRKECINVREVGSGCLVPAIDIEYRDRRGLYHIFGNISEWVDDPRYMSGTEGCVKGGNFKHHGYLKTFRFFKELFDKKKGYETVGFRCAKDIK